MAIGLWPTATPGKKPTAAAKPPASTEPMGPALVTVVSTVQPLTCNIRTNVHNMVETRRALQQVQLCLRIIARILRCYQEHYPCPPSEPPPPGTGGVHGQARDPVPPAGAGKAMSLLTAHEKLK